MNFLLLVLKCLNFYCFILQSQKMKCLVLSRYPHSDPHIKVIRRFGSFYMNTLSLTEGLLYRKPLWIHGRFPEGFFISVISTRNFVQSRNPDGCFWHPTSRTNFQSRVSPDFALKSRKAYWLPSVASNASFHFRWFFTSFGLSCV